MKQIVILALAGVLASAATLAAQDRGWGGGCPCGNCGAGAFPSGSLTELRGKVGAVQLTPGAGMPSVTVKTGDESNLVYLGSMRYLMMQGFNPKVDEDIVVKAFQMNGQFFAASVTLPAQNKTIQLRDENGRPLWRRGPRW